MEKEIRKIKRMKILIIAMALAIIFETSAFVTFVVCNAIFLDNYKAALDKAAYVDEMVEKDYQEWRENKI